MKEDGGKGFKLIEKKRKKKREWKGEREIERNERGHSLSRTGEGKGQISILLYNYIKTGNV